MEIAKYLELYSIDEHIDRIKQAYKKRRDTVVKAMEEEFPEEVTFTRPEGGLFAWIELPHHVDSRDVLAKCLEKKVAFVPGGSFFPNLNRHNTLRINFSNMPEDRIMKGIKTLAEVLREFICA